MATAKIERERVARGEGCLGKAADDEPVFVLRGQDALAAELVELWAIRAQVVRCFICGHEMLRTDTPDKTPPYRCQKCFAAIAANEADGEL